MRWMLVSAEHDPAHGGIGTYVAAFTDAACAAGWTVDLVTRAGAAHPRGASVRVVRTPDETAAFARRIPGLRRMGRVRPYRYGLWSLAVAEALLDVEERPDVVEFVDSRAEGYVALRSRRVREHLGAVPMIVHAHTPMFVEEEIHGADVSRFGRAIYHGWERDAIAAADAVVVGSRRLADRLGTAHAAVIPCLLGAGASPPEAPSEGERILLVGSVHPRKGQDVWARSLGRVLRSRPRATAEMIGPDTMTGPDGGSMAESVAALVDRDVRERFRWCGPLDHARTMAAVRSAALVVVPSRLESFGYAAAEALQCGRPVVVSDRVGLAEHVPDLPVVPVDDPEALADAQIALLADRGAAEGAARAGRDRLLAACRPQRVLALRERMAVDAAAQGRSAHVSTETAEAEMAAFLASVESAETALAV